MADRSAMRCPPRLPPIPGERPSATTEFGINNERSKVSNPLDMTEDDIERFNQWHAEHSILIPVNESCRVAVGFTVWDRIEDDGRFRMRRPHRRHDRDLAAKVSSPI